MSGLKIQGAGFPRKTLYPPQLKLVRSISSFSCSPNTIRVIGQKEVNIMQSLVLTGAGRPRRYQQGHGYRRRYRQGRGPKLQKFKDFMKKAASFGKQHILPHLQEIGTNTLLDIMEGKTLEIP